MAVWTQGTLEVTHLKELTLETSMTQPDISIVVPAFNEKHTLLDLIVQTSAHCYQQDPLRTVGYRYVNYASYALCNRGAFRQKTADVRL